MAGKSSNYHSIYLIKILVVCPFLAVSRPDRLGFKWLLSGKAVVLEPSVNGRIRPRLCENSNIHQGLENVIHRLLKIGLKST